MKPMSWHIKKKNKVIRIIIKRNRNDKENYRPVSILPSCSKIHERLTDNKLNQPAENALLIFQCDFYSASCIIHDWKDQANPS